MKKIVFYETERGKVPFTEWIDRLKDVKARALIRVKIDRLVTGSFGDVKYLQHGIYELRLHYGPGYRLKRDISMKNKRKLQDLPEYQDWVIESLKNKKEAAAYLQAAMDEYQNDGNTEAFLLALRYLALAQGGMAQLSEKTHLSRETLYRTLSKKGNPRLQTLGKLLNSLGFRLMIRAV